MPAPPVGRPEVEEEPSRPSYEMWGVDQQPEPAQPPHGFGYDSASMAPSETAALPPPPQVSVRAVLCDSYGVPCCWMLLGADAACREYVLFGRSKLVLFLPRQYSTVLLVVQHCRSTGQQVTVAAVLYINYYECVRLCWMLCGGGGHAAWSTTFQESLADAFVPPL